MFVYSLYRQTCGVPPPIIPSACYSVEVRSSVQGQVPTHKHCALASPVAKVGNASLCKRRSQSSGTQAPNVHGQPLFLAPLIPPRPRPRSLSLLRCCKYPTPPHSLLCNGDKHRRCRCAALAHLLRGAHNTCMHACAGALPLILTGEADPEHLPHTVAEVEFEA
jgi:hypothetical protein